MARAPKSMVGLYEGGLAARTWVFVVALGACQGRQPPDPAAVPAVPSQPSAAPSVSPGKAAGANAVPPSVEGRKILTDLRARLAASSATDEEQADPMLKAGLADGFHAGPGGLRPHFGPSAEPVSANLTLPQTSPAAFHLEDAGSGVAVDVSLKDAKPANAHVADGYVVYPRAHVSGATVLHRALPSGVEDFLSFEKRPAVANVAYNVALGDRVAGLRLVENTLEMLDAGGAPRLRVTPPYLVGAQGAHTDAVLAVEGCAVDKNPAGPWGRRTTAPGARACTVRVSWGAADVAYPAVLDPRWTTTGMMAEARQEHTLTRLSNGKVLVAGGRNLTVILSSAELFDPATGTWTAGGNIQSPTGTNTARRLHTAVQLGSTTNANTSGRVLVAGGISGFTGTTSVSTTSLYNVTLNTWAGGPAMVNPNPTRHDHTATLLSNASNANVVVIGGVSNTTVLNNAEIYNPTGTGFGSWSAVTNTMTSPRRGHTATLLVVPGNTTLNGQILVVGGNNGGTTNLSVNTTQRFNGTTTWTSTGTLAAAREGQTATALANGNVLIAGGKTVVSGPTTTFPQTTQVFNAQSGSGSWNATSASGSTVSKRLGHTATLLPTGVANGGKIVLLVGGSTTGIDTVDTAEVWDGVMTWTVTSALSTALPTALGPVKGHRATLIGTNTVLIAGGVNGTAPTRNAGLYDVSFGVACTTNSQCVTGFCAQGVCCATACAGTCQSCALTGTMGTCTNVAASQDPLSQCTDQGATSCGTDGFCNGAGACRQYSSATQCAAATCTGSTFTPTRMCNGTGACQTVTSSSCAPYACGASACRTACTTSTECASPNVCTGTTCGKAPIGATCAVSTDCTSNFCAQGICCATACTGTCQSCALAGSLGACSLVPNGQDPVNQCTDQGATSCGTDGACNGAGGCRIYASGTSCGAASCSGTTLTSGRSCNGTGTCQTATTSSCNPYQCGTGACRSSCTVDTECVNLYSCVGGTCGGREDITFYKSYDTSSTIADLAKTTNTPITDYPVLSAPGLFGLGVESSTSMELAYQTTVEARPTNIDLSAPGSASVWIKANGSYSPAAAAGQLLVFAHDYRARLRLEVRLAESGITGEIHDLRVPAEPSLYVTSSSGSTNWATDGQWHLLVVNWSRFGVAISFDAGPTYATNAPWLRSVPPATGAGNVIYAGGLTWPGGSVIPGLVKDELMILNRPLSDTEIQTYYARRLTPTVPNPALADFGPDKPGLHAATNHSFVPANSKNLRVEVDLSSLLSQTGLGEVSLEVVKRSDDSVVDTMTIPTWPGNIAQADWALPGLVDYTYASSTNNYILKVTLTGTGAFASLPANSYPIAYHPSACTTPTEVCRSGAGTRNPATGLCIYGPSANGTICMDGNACTDQDTCIAGICTPGPDVPRDDFNTCTEDSCDPALGPVHTPTNEGGACDDGNGCTASDLCRVGACQPGAVRATCGVSEPFYAPVVDIGSFGPDGTKANGINASGEVVGTGWFPSYGMWWGERIRTFRFTDAGGLVPVGGQSLNCRPWSCSAGWAISDSGIVAGQVWGGGAAYTQAPGELLHEYYAEIGNSVAFAINADGVFAGYDNHAPTGSLAFRYSPQDGLLSLGTLPIPSSHISSWAYGIDTNGRVVGGTGVGFPDGHAFLFADGQLRDLNDLANAGHGFTSLHFASAVTVNHIVGYGYRPDGTNHGFRYHENGDVDDIGTLPGMRDSSASAVNKRGDVVGQLGSATGESRAFVYTNEGVLRDLNDFVDPDSGWTLETASGINGNPDSTTFEVVGWGRHGTAPIRAFKMKLPNLAPCPVSTDTCHPGSGTRNLATNECTYTPVAEGTACDDANANTSVDACRTGTCFGSNPPTTGSGTFAGFTDLGVIDGARRSGATAINTGGDVAGTEFQGSVRSVAWRFTAEPSPGALAPIGVSPADSGYTGWEATGINDSRTVVGVTGFRGEGFMAPSGQNAQIITGGHGDGSANGINVAGQIAATERYYIGAVDQGYVSAFRRNPDGTKYHVGQIQGSTAGGGTFSGLTVANGIAPNSTDLVGYAGMTELNRLFDAGTFDFVPPWGMREAYRFMDPYTGPADRHNLNDNATGGWDLLYEATATNGTYVVGWGVKDTRCRAFRYTVATNEVRDLGILDELQHPAADMCWTGDTNNRHFNYYTATSINSNNEIVGSISYGGAFYYNDAQGQMIDLQDLVDPALNVTLQSATGINASHEIVGSMTVAGDPQSRAYKMTLPDWVVNPGDPLWANVFPQVDGIVDVGGGNYVAVFGYRNTGTTEVQILPGVGANSFTRNNGPAVANPNPAPPLRFVPGTHAGSFLPKGVVGETLSWTVAGKPKSITITPSTMTPLAHVPIGVNGGYGVTIDGSTVVIQPDLGPYVTPPQEPQLAEGDPVFPASFNGALTGTLGVGPSGAATYTVPISIPPGIAGMAPDLNLVYSSQGRNSIVGQGWNLTGQSAIHRCPKTRAQDGYSRSLSMGAIAGPGGPDRNDNDGVCLDGQRLFFQQGPPSDTSHYTPETQDYTDISFSTTTKAFVVRTKSGERRYYGSTTASRVRFPSSLASESSDTGSDPAPSDGNVTAIWALDRVVDAWGNFYDLRYNQGFGAFSDSGLLLTEIKYTGHLAGSGEDETQPFETITLAYDPTVRPDVRQVRFGASTLPMKHRLTRITTSRGFYLLNYEEPDENMLPSRLKKVDYCRPYTGGANCLKALEFDWDGGGYRWDPAPEYALPASIAPAFDEDLNPILPGTQFVDLDGDGRLDFVQSKKGVSPDPLCSHGVWRNNGQRWECTPASWKLPEELVHANGRVNAVLADLDGDGLQDLISGTRVTCGLTCPTFGPCEPYCNPLPPVAFLNRLKTDGVWIAAPAGYATLPQGWGNFVLGAGDNLADMDGDGLVDIFRMGTGDDDGLRVALNTGIGWEDKTDPYGITGLGRPIRNQEPRDINRDGLLDFVARGADADDTIRAAINTGLSFPQGAGWGYPFVFRTFAADPISNGPPITTASGDLDGDGIPDGVIYDNRVLPGLKVGVSFATGAGFITGISVPLPVPQSFSTPFTLPYQKALADLSAPQNQGVDSRNQTVSVADINADGLADVIQNHWPSGTSSGQGQVLFNTGTTFKDLDGLTSSWQQSAGTNPVPLTPGVERRHTFIDLNGDGVVDVAGDTSAWINRFRPPVITHFPNGLANKSVVAYLTISSATAQTANGSESPTYVSSGYLSPRQMYSTPPLRVASSVTVDNGAGSTSRTSYRYEDMRSSSGGRGSQGFRRFIERGPSGIETRTTFAQPYPYTGRTVAVERNSFDPVTKSETGPLTKTVTDYCDRLPPSPCTPPTGSTAIGPWVGTIAVFPITVTDTTYLRTSASVELNPAEFINTTTTFRYDARGNVLQSTIKSESSDSTEETYERDTVNVYGQAGSEEERQGKVTESTVTARRLRGESAMPVVHTTAFVYGNVNAFSVPPEVVGANPPVTVVNTLALRVRKVEPGARAPIELHTAYAYDRFGNVTTTTSCANEFPSCAPGAVVNTDPPHRTTTVSYDPADFNFPLGIGLVNSLWYGKGRFPVKTVTGVGYPEAQTEYSAYFSEFGTLRQKTSVNGVHTCFTYDDFGTKTSDVDRCGSGASLTTMFHRYLATGSPSLAKVVNVTSPPGAGKTWVYTDALDRVIQTQGRSFEGGFTLATTTYDAFGRVSGTLKPRLSSESSLLYPSTITYDGLGRVKEEDRNLGPIQGGDPLAVGADIVKTTYQGSGILTEHRVSGILRARYERKNVLGKVALVKVALDGDAPDSAMKFLFDAEGNLTDTKDSLEATANTIHIEYDARGRKRLSRDPDLGEWTYVYNGFGDLISQTDAKRNKTTMAYDVLGRVVRKTELADTANESVSQWIYDVAPGAGKGKLATMVGAPDPRLTGPPCDIRDATLTDGKRTGRWFNYDEFGAVVQSDECTDGTTFSSYFEYDAFGRQNLIRYPAVLGERLVVKYNYTGLGFLHFVSDATTNNTYWVASSMNALGQVTAEVTGSGVRTVSERNRATGWLQGSTSTAFADNNNLIQSWTYRYDEAGNLRTRLRQDKVNVANSAEYFGYDRLERLNYATVEAGGNTTTQWYVYDRLGNLTEKAGKTYTYSGCAAGGGPHAVCRVGTDQAYSYDANGNMTIGRDRNITYNASNKVIHVDSHPATSQGNDTGVVDFIYGADGNRVVQEVTGGTANASAQTVYVGMGGTGKSLYERTRRGTGGEVEHVQFIYAGGAHGGNAFAVRAIKENGASTEPPALKYYHFDHLGSVTAMSDEVGRVVDAAWGGAKAGVLGYDAWGARRNPDGTEANPASFDQQVGHREFTGHETIPNVGLVNMNGRVYDPVLGRFLSPDPTIQFAADLQNYNRYSYVLNNPLRYSDPTGYSISGWDIARAGLGIALGVGGAAICAYSAGVGCVAFGLWAAGVQGMVAVASGASVDQALMSGAIGFMSGMAFGGIGGAAAQGLGGDLGAQLVGGAISGALGGAMTTAIAGGSGEDIAMNALVGAVSGAAMAGVSYSFRVNALSQASSAPGAHGSGETTRAAADGGGSYDGDRERAQGAAWGARKRSDLMNRRGGIVRAAMAHKGESKFDQAAAYDDRFRPGSNKCNLFNAVVAREAKAPIPHNRFGFPPTANALANGGVDPISGRSWKMSGSGWVEVTGPAMGGDLIAYGRAGESGHTAVVVKGGTHSQSVGAAGVGVEQDGFFWENGRAETTRIWRWVGSQ